MKKHEAKSVLCVLSLLLTALLLLAFSGCGDSYAGPGPVADGDTDADDDEPIIEDGDEETLEADEEAEIESESIVEDGDLELEEEIESAEIEDKEDIEAEEESVIEDGDEDDIVKPCEDWDGLEDLPDENLIDNDCDGIDGNKNNAIFVDPVNGLYMGEGTIEYPVSSLSKAIELASNATPPKDIYIAKGLYQGPFVLTKGTSLYGGFDPDNNWSRHAGNPSDADEEYTTRIQVTDEDESGNIRSIVANDIDIPIAIAFLSIVSGSNHNDAGGSSYGVFVSRSASVTVHNCDIKVGDGSKGQDGVVGTKGDDGVKGGKGDNAKEEGWNPENPTNGGVGSSANCDDPNTSGGNGGHGGWGSVDDSPNGHDGYAAYAAGDYGAGSGFADGGSPHLDGSPGRNAAHGLGGDGSGMPDESGLWNGSVGDSGQSNGGNGIGGGGGGGGGGSEAGICNNWWGGAGGGGGSGGCGGTPGTGGQGGGGSFGIYYYQSTPLVYSTYIIVGNGGKGGNGAFGGEGGAGGAGGDGGSGKDITCGLNDSHHAYAGGKGAAGGKGGKGGSGGGGGGGISYGIYSYQMPSGYTAEISDVDITEGNGGPGGVSPEAGDQYQGLQGESGDVVHVDAEEATE